MSNRCYLCGNVREKSNKIILHAFPKDETVRNKWISACGLSSWDNVKNVKVCSTHFSPQDYKQSRKFGHAATILNKDAVPSVGLPTQRKQSVSVIVDQSSRNAQLQLEATPLSKADFRNQHHAVNTTPKRCFNGSWYISEVTPSAIPTPLHMELMNKKTTSRQACNPIQLNSEELQAMGGHGEGASSSTSAVEICSPHPYVTNDDALTIKEEELSEDAEFLTDDEADSEKTKTSDEKADLRVTQSLRSTTHLQPTHSDIQTHLCALCNERFLSSADLLMHERTHLATYKLCGNTVSGLVHSCSTCRKKYATKAQLDQHLQLHLSKWQHKCVPCDRVFSNSVEINAHNLETHAGKEELMCWLCKTRFDNPAGLQAHVAQNKKRNASHKCDICQRTFLMHCHLIEHLCPDGIKGIFPCEHCDKRFEYPCAIQVHRRQHDVVDMPPEENELLDFALDMPQPQPYPNVVNADEEPLAFASIKNVVFGMPQPQTYPNVVNADEEPLAFASIKNVVLGMPQPQTYPNVVNADEEPLAFASIKNVVLGMPQPQTYPNVVNADEEPLAFANNKNAVLGMPQPLMYPNVVKTEDDMLLPVAVSKGVEMDIPSLKTYLNVVNAAEDKVLASPASKYEHVALEWKMEDDELLPFADSKPAPFELPQSKTYPNVNTEDDGMSAFPASKGVSLAMADPKTFQTLANVEDDELLAFAGNNTETPYKGSKSVAKDDKNEYITSFQKFLEQDFGSIKQKTKPTKRRYFCYNKSHADPVQET